MNKAILLGFVGKDPEHKQLANSEVCTFSLATSRKVKDEEKTEWHSIVVWGKLAEICSKYVSKGSQLLIEGEIQTRSWEKDGKTNYKTEIVAREVKFIGKPVGPKEEQEQFNPDDLPF